MQMAKTRRRIGAHHIDIALAAAIEEMRARPLRQDNRERRIIFRAKAVFARDHALRGHRALQGHGGLLAIVTRCYFRTKTGALDPEIMAHFPAENLRQSAFAGENTLTLLEWV